MQETVNRKVSYKLYLSKAQEKLLGEFFELHRRLYNSMLEQRIMGWKSARQSISFADQCKQITLLRKECSEFQALNAQSMQVTAKRLDLAYRSFFSRVKHGNTPGFPRFKSHDRFSGWGYKEHGDGWRIYTSQAKKVTNKQKTRGGFVRILVLGSFLCVVWHAMKALPKQWKCIKKQECGLFLSRINAHQQDVLVHTFMHLIGVLKTF